MHPYEMQRCIRDWHKDAFLDLKRGSLYHSIERLRRFGCIDAVETTREGKRPERTVYRLTEDGGRQMLQWLSEMLAKPACEPTQFFAALSFLPALSPKGAAEELQARIGLLEQEIASLDGVLQTMVPKIGRLVLVEVEYILAMRQAELAWVRTLLDDLQAGKLAWDPKQFCQMGPGSNSSSKDRT
jgi:DNA-binding PadR family transcriptional regulator